MADRIEALDGATWNSKAALLALAPELLPLLDPHLPTYLIASLDEASLILELIRYVNDVVGSQR
jgi:hypothetical protein